MSVPRAVEVTSRTQAWLRGDLSDVAEVVPRRPSLPSTGAEAIDVQTGLGRWSAALTRWRAVGLARRYLLIALALALVPAIVLLLTGGRRPLWVLAILALAPVAAAVGLFQRTSAARAARLVDRALGLHEQIGTALELQTSGTPVAGLAAMVITDAQLALGESFLRARVRGRRAPGEWAWIALALCALVVLLAVPRHAGTVTGSEVGASATAGASARAGSAPRARAGAGGVTHTTSRSAQTTGSTPALRQVPLTSGGAKAAYGVQATTTPGGHTPVYVNGSGTVEGQHTKPGLEATGGAGAGTQNGGARQTGSPAGGGGTTTGASAATAHGGKSGAGSSAKASSGAQGGRSAVTSTTPGKTAGAASGSQRGINSGGTPAGGGAGNGKAAAHSKLGLQPYGSGTGNLKAQLPLQSSYTPSGAGHVSAHEGVSQTTSGNGKGAGTSGHPGSGAAAGGQSTTSFSVIPPSSNASAAADGGLLHSYFGSANQLTFKGW